MPSFYSRRVLKGISLDTAVCRRLELRELSPAEKRQDLQNGRMEDRGEAAETAAQIVAQAEEETVRIREEAYRQGFEAGFRDGRARGEEKAREMMERARAVLNEAEAERAAVLSRLEKEIVALAQEIARRIVAAELRVNPQVIVGVAKEALALVRDRPHLMLLVHPEDQAVCQQARREFEALLPENAVLRILPDLGVERGGCIIETGEGVVDATMGTRWARMVEELKGLKND
uniref:Flagellar assembly protein FliH/Type III secretion system HrpE domain-containing protein n=1 Tax=Ammonifex degensii TaxID=42838 RepID=A0A7C1IZN8_9THEO